jgi:hypothetical protein
MKKITALAFSILLLFSCGNKNSRLIEENSNLKRINDSLNNTLNIISKKYVFDSIAVAARPNDNNSLKMNSSYQMDVYIIAYNKANKQSITKIDSNLTKELNSDRGVYHYDKKLTDVKNMIMVDINIPSVYGKNISGRITDLVEIDSDSN